MVGFPISSRLTQGPAVSVADRHHSLRLGMLTMTRSAYLQVRCAVVALWSEHLAPVRSPISTREGELDSIMTASPLKPSQFRPGTLPGTDGPSGSTNSRSVGVVRPLDPRLSVIALWSLSETRCLRHPPPTTGCPAYVLVTCLLRAPYGPSGRGSAP